jgi:very-short-patch-repair endonuclease
MADYSNDPAVIASRADSLALVGYMCSSEYADAVRANVVEEVGRTAGYLESPIEAMFLWRFTAFAHAHWAGPIATGTLLRLEPQVWFDDQDYGRYRMDFEIRLRGHRLNVAVELDGHQFHERTPEQVEKRNARDNRLQLHQWKVVRFSGRQVFREGGACAAAAWLTAYQRAHRWGLLDGAR